MHGRVVRTAGAVALLLASLAVAVPLAQAAGSGPPASCDPTISTCDVETGVPGSPGTPGAGGGGTGGGGGGKLACLEGLTPVPCSSESGSWSNSEQCYLRLMNPPPPFSSPYWEGHTTGAVYFCTTALSPTTRLVWFAGAPPIGPTPEQLARQAFDSLTVPRPVMRRSPDESNSDAGVPYTWVNLWTWVWTDPVAWTPLTARATAGATWAEVTVTPRSLTFVPGDGGKSVTCVGPGRPWTEADGNAAPGAGGCGYQYKHVSGSAVTATMAIDWTVTWTGSGGTSGTLPALQTQATSTFAVQQIQVVTR